MVAAVVNACKIIWPGASVHVANFDGYEIGSQFIIGKVVPVDHFGEICGKRIGSIRESEFFINKSPGRVIGKMAVNAQD